VVNVLQTSDVVDWEFFRIGDQYYLAAAVATSSSSSSSSGHSTVYRLDKVRKQFDVYQHITTHRSVARWHHMHTIDFIQKISSALQLLQTTFRPTNLEIFAEPLWRHQKFAERCKLWLQIHSKSNSWYLIKHHCSLYTWFSFNNIHSYRLCYDGYNK